MILDMFGLFKKKKEKKDKEKEIRYDWKDISIKQFIDISKVDREDEDIIFKYLAIINNVDLEAIYNMPYPEVMRMAKGLSFLSKAPKHRLPQKRYTINEVEYEVMCDPNKMTTAQYIDFQMLDSDYNNHIPELLAIILVPVGKKYNEDYDMDKAKEDIFNYLGIEEAFGLCDFFSTWSSVYIRLIMGRLTREIRKAAKMAQTEELKTELTEAADQMEKIKKERRLI